MQKVYLVGKTRIQCLVKYCQAHFLLKGVCLLIYDRIDSKYIYLDWNVIKYMKTPRLDNNVDIQFKDAVFRLKEKFCFPYSVGHIKDRANGYSDKHIKEVIDDLSFAEVINEQQCVGMYNNEPIIIKKSMSEFWKEYIDQKNIGTLPKENMWNLPELAIDISKINEDHPMYGFLKNHNGILSAYNINEFLEDTIRVSDTI